MSGFDGFERVVPGILHWRAAHPGIGQIVHSYLVEDAGAALDPIGAEGLVDGLRGRGGVEVVLLTNRHHYRAADALVDAFDCPVRCPQPGLHEFEGGGPDVDGYAWGEQLADGIVAHEVGGICPDDGALHVDRGAGALALADGVIRWDGRLSFVPDALMDEPERTKSELLGALGRLLELDFDALLLAHGEPIPSGGKQALAEFLAAPAQADFSDR